VITAILVGLGLDLTTAAGAIAACRRMLRLLRTIPGCCPVCNGAGGDYNGPCWDCQATGHPHLGLCMWGDPRAPLPPAEGFQTWQAHLRSRSSVSKTGWMEL
jgi:hypothetical protein